MENITKLVANIEKSKEIQTIEILTWPYSRKIIYAICESKGIDVTSKVSRKNYEEYKANTKDNFEITIKAILKEVQRQAKLRAEDKQTTITIERNNIADGIVIELEKRPKAKPIEIKSVPNLTLKCPQCESTKYKKNGKNKHGEQRHQCKECYTNF